MSETGSKPEISVVIPTRGRETRLAFALDALAAQELAAERFEVVVVRDGPGSGPRAAAPEGLRATFLEIDGPRGPAAARNAGWRAAGGDLIAFTDDDCRPSPGWLAALLAAGDGEATLVQGRTEPDPDELHLLGGLARSQLVDAPGPWLQTCNVRYSRVLLERLGGFDETFLAGEDSDLGLRALESGARQAWAPRALVWHAVHPRHVHAAVREALRWEVVPRLVKRHPQLRGAIRHRVFWKEAHARLVLAALGLAVARSGPLRIALATPYVALHLRAYERGPRGLARASLDLPARTAVDAAELLAVMRGAIGSRTFVL